VAAGRQPGRAVWRLSDGFHHQGDGRISGVRESEQVTGQHRAQAARHQEHARSAHDAEKQLQTADAGPVFGPGEQAVPRSGGVVQGGVDLV